MIHSHAWGKADAKNRFVDALGTELTIFQVSLPAQRRHIWAEQHEHRQSYNKAEQKLINEAHKLTFKLMEAELAHASERARFRGEDGWVAVEF